MDYFQVLWPDGIFFTRVGIEQNKAGDAELSLVPFQIGQFGGSKVSNQGSFEEQLEAARRASDIKKMLLGEYNSLKQLVLK